MKFRTSIAVVALVLSGVLTGCQAPPPTGGPYPENTWPFAGGQYPFDILPEMHYGQRQRIQEPDRQPPPANSVPVTGRFAVPLQVEQARGLANPVSRTQATTEAGRRLYEVNCIVCHGPQGQGNGRAAAFFLPPPQGYGGKAPTNIQSPEIVAQSDGEIFFNLYYGKNFDIQQNIQQRVNGMPAFGNVLTEEQIWTLVTYVRVLQQGQR